MLTTPQKELVTKYLDALPKQVEPAFAAACPVLKLLKSEMARRVFVPFPKKWTGINGFEEIELEWRDDMPERMSSRARPVNPQNAEVAKIEFDRLCISSAFADYADWIIIIFDNILLLAHTYEDLYDKLVKVLIRCCDDRSVNLKITKSFFGVTKANFFGYKVSDGTYHLSQQRRDAIASIPMP